MIRYDTGSEALRRAEEQCQEAQARVEVLETAMGEMYAEMRLVFAFPGSQSEAKQGCHFVVKTIQDVCQNLRADVCEERYAQSIQRGGFNK